MVPFKPMVLVYIFFLATSQLHKPVNALYTDICKTKDHNCSADKFPCFRDCCDRGEQFCDTSKREQRCRYCDKKKALCGHNSMPVECLLYCHKQLQPVHNETKTDTSTDSDSGSSIHLTDVVVGFICGCVITAVVALLIYLRKRCRSCSGTLKDSRNGSSTSGSRRTSQDQNLHESLIGLRNSDDMETDDRVNLVLAPNNEPRGETRAAAPASSETISPSPPNVQPPDDANTPRQPRSVPDSTDVGLLPPFANDIEVSGHPAPTPSDQPAATPPHKLKEVIPTTDEPTGQRNYALNKHDPAKIYHGV